MSWQQMFLERFGTGGLGGMSLSTWLKCLSENRFSIDAPYVGRALTTTLSCAQNSLYRRWEHWRFGQAVRDAEIHSPIFVLGLWRSGTTHLHNLLSKDPRFAFPNTYQVFFPHTFLTTESWNAGLFDWMLPSRRVQDNVRLGADQPQEDDFAIAGLTGMSFMLSMAFSRNAAAYNRFITLDKTSESEKERWRKSLVFFLKKLTVKYDQPLVLKSPAHTAHVCELVRLFPQAKFVLIHRDPFEVLASILHTFDKVFEMWALQRLGSYDIVESTIRNCRRVTESYFQQRHAIPAGNLVEIAFRDLESAPLETLRHLYHSLSLPDFTEAEGPVRSYLASLGNYRKNHYSRLDVALQRRVQREWEQYFTGWGYNEREESGRAA